MPKVRKSRADIGRLIEGVYVSNIVDEWRWFCTGCGFEHGFLMDGRWSFDGNEDSPTFSPSLLLKKENGWEYTCHTFVKNGMIEYLSDCGHHLAGQTIEMTEFPDLPEKVG